MARILRNALFIVGCLAGCLIAISEAPATASPVPVPPASTLSGDDAAAWLDGFMPYALARGSIPGAIVIVVKDGQVILKRGYGVADTATGRPVDPDATLFRLGSVSKLFTFTAVMQQVELGRIDLDADINRYLDFRVPALNGRPITMRQLMTHTGGFEEATRGIATVDKGDVPSLGAALRRWVPARIFAPGSTPAYSNYGAALAGYIVERVSGEPLPQYIAHHITTPLGMSRTTFAQPLPAALAADLSQGYLDQESPPQPFERVVWSPVGAGSSTGSDMARFMLAHLQSGQLDGHRILSAATAARMQALALATFPPLDGMALGFYEKSINGHRVIGHDGDTVLFHTVLELFPDDHVGIFVALNAAGRDNASFTIRKAVLETFTDRYFPRKAMAATIPIAVARAHASEFVGEYEPTRRSASSFLAGAFILGQVSVVTNDDGSISVSGLNALDGAPRRYREFAPYLWEEKGGHDRLRARVADGRVTAFATDEESPVMSYWSVPWWRSAALLLPAGALALVVLIAVLVWRFVAFFTGRHYRQPGTRGRAFWLTTAANLLAIAAAGGWFWVLLLLAEPTGIYQLDQHATGIHLVQFCTMLAALVGVTAWMFVLIRSMRRWRTLALCGLNIAAFAALIWVAAIGNLFGFGMNY
jgi:CubicO group peptidase (beta-lactamase class C family)